MGIMVTCPSVGARTRMVVQPDTTVDTIVATARSSLGFDQPFLNDSDFEVYLKSDESTPISGKIGDHGLVPWGPEGMELHIYFDPPLNCPTRRQRRQSYWHGMRAWPSR